MENIGVMVVAIVSVLVLMVALWVLSLRLKDASIVDRFWGVGFVWVAIWSALAADGLDWRRLLVLSLVTIWGTRLALHIHLRNRGHAEDYRYAEMRRQHGGSFWWYSLISVFLLQGAVMLVVSAPLIVVMAFPGGESFGLLDGLGILLWASGLFFEAMGDHQLKVFRANPANRGQVLDSGLWSLTRHPNYFGDFLVWIGFYLLACGAEWGVVTFFSPLVMGLFLRFVSGVDLLEKRLSATKPGYADYAARTPAFIPDVTKLARIRLWMVGMVVIVAGCETTPKLPPLETVASVDLNRYMGDWYVIGGITTFLEKDAHNGVEVYEQNADGTIAITFRFRDGSFDGKEKTYHPVGRVVDSVSNSRWEVQFLWPFWADYLILDLAEDYSWVVVGVPSRSYVWIMARQPQLDQSTWLGIVDRLRASHHDVDKIKMVPQQAKKRAAIGVDGGDQVSF